MNLKTYIIGYLSFCTLNAIAQHSVHISTSNGLSTNSLTIITRSHDNTMWVGSYNGLNKHEGSVIKNYSAGGNYDRSLSSGEMHAVFEDRLGFVWLGTTAGVDKLDPVTGKIIHYTVLPNGEKTSSVGYIISIWQDDEDNMWIATWAGIQVLNYATGKLTTISEGKTKKTILSKGVGYKTTVKTKEGIWISTDMGLMFYQFKSKQFFHSFHNPEKNPVFDLGKPFLYSNGTSSGMCADSKGNLYFVSFNNQLIQYNPTSKIMKSFPFIYPDKAWNCCISVEADERDNIWLGFRHGGLLVYNAVTGEFQPIKYSDHNSLIKSNYIYSLCRDYLGNMWVATDNGLDIINLYDSSTKLFNLSSTPDFTNLKYSAGELSFQAPSQLYIPFQGGGIMELDTKRDSIIHHITSDEEKSRVSLIIPTNSSRTIYASYPNEASLIQLANKPPVSSTGFLPLIARQELGSANWWYQTKSNSHYIKKLNGTIVYIDSMGRKEIMNGYGYKPAIGISPDKKYLWYVDANTNLVRRNINTNISDTVDLQPDLLKQKFSFFNVRNLKDDGESVWLTCQNGLVRYNHSTGVLLTYSVLNGLSHSFTFALETDNANHLWVESLGGIDVFNRQTNSFSNAVLFTEGTYMDAFGSATKTPDGTLYFNSGNRLVRIMPEKYFARSTVQPQLMLQEIKVNDKIIALEKQSILKSLPYNKNKLYFRFGLLDFQYPQKIKYSWYLEGLEKGWNEPGRITEINYATVPPGNYSLHIMAIGAYGKEIIQQVNLPIKILPPWWSTWWFRLLAVFGTILTIYTIVKLNQERSRRKEAQKMVGYFMNSGNKYSSVEDVLWDVARNCIARLNFEDCVIYLKDPTRDVLIQKAAFGPKNPKEYEIYNPLEIPFGKGIVGDVANTGRAEIIGDTTKDKRYIIDDASRKSELTVPIIRDNKVIGIIDSEHRRRGFFKHYHLQALTDIASVCVSKIINVEAQAEIKEKEDNLKELNRQMNESRMMAIRSQMNPHFIFNSLNAIQELIITEKIDEAYQYLSSFSSLLRMVLRNSEKDMVPLSAELQAIRLQLSLESLRFKNSFTYHIETDKEVELDMINIPPLLLQPFVENAVWHGLRHKKGKQTLWIRIKDKEQAIQIEIEDDGIGRTKANRIKTGKLGSDRFDSKGSGFSEQRIAILNQQSEGAASIEIIDLYNENNEARGTKIVINLRTKL